MARLNARVGATLIAVMLGLTAPAIGGTMARLERDAVEQPHYTVLDNHGSIEIREYGPRLAAETDMRPDAGIEDGQDSAFMTLAAYIFAQDREGPAVAMTAPVAVEQAAPIAMTAPVAVETRARGAVMRFYMPAEYTLQTLPRPGSDRIRIVSLPPQVLAVLRFSGEATDALIAAKQDELLQSLHGSDWQPIASPGFFAYDPPTTPSELRRNEVFVEVTAALAQQGSPTATTG